MTQLAIYKRLKDSYEISTRNANHFEAAIKSIGWDAIFEADGEMYYSIDRFTLIIGSVNPFQGILKPSVIFSDGSMVSFG